MTPEERPAAIVTTSEISDSLAAGLQGIGITPERLEVTLRSGDVLVTAHVRPGDANSEVTADVARVISEVVEGRLRFKLAEPPRVVVEERDVGQGMAAFHVLRTPIIAAGNSSAASNGDGIWREFAAVVVGLVCAFVITGALQGGPIVLVLTFLPSTALARLAMKRGGPNTAKPIENR